MRSLPPTGPNRPYHPDLSPVVGYSKSQSTLAEADWGLPPFPSLFIKPDISLADYSEVVSIPQGAEEYEADGEGEVCAVA
ncbi:hypothetical protein EHS25_000860 [Saitozyma podzolica]|uniref:Uncharacterized protein n=1 Tax=Saitozyma podzolica TaxID=1890683 RepID=A0A427YXF1_9TREE|nr:hypothetical protein EHS25_000860 [Saitozyma podzolica]